MVKENKKMPASVFNIKMTCFIIVIKNLFMKNTFCHITGMSSGWNLILILVMVFECFNANLSTLFSGGVTSLSASTTLH